MNQQQKTNNQQPSVRVIFAKKSYRAPTTNNQQPTTNNRQPTTDNR